MLTLTTTSRTPTQGYDCQWCAESFPNPTEHMVHAETHRGQPIPVVATCWSCAADVPSGHRCPACGSACHAL